MSLLGKAWPECKKTSCPHPHLFFYLNFLQESVICPNCWRYKKERYTKLLSWSKQRKNPPCILGTRALYLSIYHGYICWWKCLPVRKCPLCFAKDTLFLTLFAFFLKCFFFQKPIGRRHLYWKITKWPQHPTGFSYLKYLMKI